ncbi:MAG: hypothetical protein QOE51_1452 [Actinoplanes sp.]|jgi:hypothetical protein|nr:hypothetical protein [Actinoplanes sp.]
MGDLRDRIRAIYVRASSPDDAITAELTGRNRVTMSFARGWYDRCDETELERKLSSVATLLWTARMRRYWEVRSADAGVRISGEPKPIGPRAVAYHQARDALVAHGRSADGRVSAVVEGMRRWTIQVRRGTIREIDEHEFAAAAGQAAAELIQDQYRKIAALKLTIYS